MEKRLRNNVFRRNSSCYIDSSVVWMLGFIYSILSIRDTESSSFSRVSEPIGRKAKLPCSTEITGSIHVQWLDPSGTALTYDESVQTGDSRFKIDHSYLREWNLEIENVRRSDAGNYTCSIGPTTIVNSVVELAILVSPSLIRTSGNLSSMVGNQVMLFCEASGEPKPTITWTRLTSNNGSKLDLKQEGSELNISAVTIEDAGTYECQANNNMPPSAVGRMRLEILFGPQVTVLFREVSQNKGGSTLLTCLIRANPAKELFWERNGTIVVNSNRYQIHNWETGEYQTTFGLFITGLIDSDFGEYRCIAANDYGRAKGKITVNEYEAGKVRIISTPQDVLVRVNDSVLFECSVHGLDLDDSLIWRRILPGGDLQTIFISHLSEASIASLRSYLNETFQFDHNKYEIRGQYSLYIKQVDFSDGGTYVCDVSGIYNFSAELTVVDKRAFCGNNTMDVFDGDPVTLSCSLTYGGLAPHWHITWVQEKLPVASVADDSMGLIKRTLQFNASYPHSTGTYQCVITELQLGYLSSCRVALNILSSETGNLVIANRTAESCTYASNTLVIIILSSIAVVCFIVAVISVCWLVTYHKQEMTKFKEPPKPKSKQNGSVDTEMALLICSSPSPQPPA